MPSTHLNLREDDVVRLALEFLHNRDLHITQLSLERETGVINGNFADDVLFLRQLILDGQWDDVLEFIQPLSALKSFQTDKFHYAILRHKYIELLCIRSEIKAYNNVENIVDEVVKVLSDLEKLAPSKEEYSNLCLLLTLPSITDHAQFKKWNPSNARVQCFREVYPLVEQFLPCDKKSSGASPKCAKNDRLMQLLIKGILYESCVNYCQAKATGSKEAQSNEVNFSRLLDGSGFDESDLSLLSWLQSIPAETFSVPFEQRMLNVDVEKLERPSLHTSWTEHMLVTPIKPRTFPHLAMPFRRPRSAADAMTRSLRPLPDGAPRHPAVMALSAIDYGPSSSCFAGFHLTGIKGSKLMNTSVDRLFDNINDESLYHDFNEPLNPIEEKLKPIGEITTSTKTNDSSVGASNATTPEHRGQDYSASTSISTTAVSTERSSLAERTAQHAEPVVAPNADGDFRRDLLKEYQIQKQRECDDYIRNLCSSELRPQKTMEQSAEVPSGFLPAVKYPQALSEKIQDQSQFLRKSEITESIEIADSTHVSVCNKFLKMSRDDRYKYVKDNNWCSNCLGSSHWASTCQSKFSCRKCSKRHHTLLHIDNLLPPAAGAVVGDSQTHIDGVNSSDSSKNNSYGSMGDNQVSLCTMSALNRKQDPTTEILGTAIVLAVGRNGKDVRIRCLLDPGSQKHYITTRCVRMLDLSIDRGLAASVRGIGGSTQPVRGSVDFKFRSQAQRDKVFCINALVLDNITSRLPTCTIDMKQITGFEHLTLADEFWGRPSEVDLLIGVELFADLLLPGKVINKPGLPNAIETVLGYIVLGNAPVKSLASSSLSFCATYEVNNLIKKFWEIEDLGSTPPLSLDEKRAEEIYKSTVRRDGSGRYEVALPFKSNPNQLGNSYNTAMRRYLNLESKFKFNSNLKCMYDTAIREHIDKKYLSEIESKPNEDSYYIPHHAVVREDKTTTKLRVVLDASSATDTGVSLNDVLLAGPSLQTDLFCILLNFRLFPVAISGDVSQMYLAIKVRETDRCYQRIFTRFSAEQPISIYQYNRVAFGLRCSPFLALRTVQQLISDEGDRFPVAKEIASRDIYMDDIACSVIDEDKANIAVHELIDMFMAGGFQLAKWSSNSMNVLEQIPEERRLSQIVSFNEDTTFKILGLQWYPAEDIFCFSVTPDERPCTKRHILSCVARLFDVLGLVAPIILFAKLLIKDLWIAKIEWDEVPPKHIVRKWNQFQRELSLISRLKFPRHIGVVKNCSLTILGFADASEKAYGAVVYACVAKPDISHSITLISSKSKVAPLKVVSLARLELCAALLLAQLIQKILNNYSPRYHIQSILAFSDSVVALSWIHSEPYRWQTFVANRVSKIHECLDSNNFYYVKGTENPSDCLSRGLTPAQLIDHPLWFKGPPWASQPKEFWPVKPFVGTAESESLPEAKTVSFVAINTANENIIYLMSSKFSSWNKYIRSVAYILKFLKKLDRGPITGIDLDFAENFIIRVLQQVYFFQEINDLNAGRSVSDNLKQLNPFIDNGIIRVGGRLANSSESYDFKHQILLPRRDHIVELLIDHYHRINCHAGPETLLFLLRNRYWIVAARRIIRQRIRQCNACFRTKPRPTFPMMSDLPSFRVNPVDKAFTHTGCDYAGPLLYTPQRRRGVKGQKAYLCIFTCLTTRAVHIELAIDLSTASFLAAFKRFLSRRGPVKVVHSDNGTNFVGAKSYLRELHKFLSTEYKEYWEKELAENRITWQMICPSAPHHGGSWESVVKVVKTHLFRTVGAQILSYEELLTVLIEALINSRPLYTLSSDPTEPTALTPAHFLNVIPLKYLPANDAGKTVDHLLKRHELMDKIVQSFWKRWRDEYLHSLQARRKWNTPSQPIREGDVVILMQDSVMPMHWPLGVVVKPLPGKDGIVRVALVKTKTGTYQRPVVKLCPLPTQ